MALWLKADAGVTIATGVSRWADQSGNGNDVTQSTGSNQPAFNSNSINGLPGITFAASKALTRTTSPLTSGQDRTVVMVCKPASNGGGVFTVGGPAVVFKVDNTACWIGYVAVISGLVFGWGNNVASDQLSSGPTILNTPMVAEIATQVNSLPAFTFNGTGYANGAANNVSSDNGTDGFAIGNKLQSSLWATQFFAGDVCEILVYGSVLGATSLNTLRKYLQNRYAINLGV